MNKFLYWLAAQTTPQSAYNLCHFLVGLLTVLIVGRWSGHFIYACAGLMAFAATKEFWFDANYESKTLAGNDLLDFVGYVLGAGAGYLLAVYLP